MHSFEMQLSDIPATDLQAPSAIDRPILLASPHSGRVYPTCFLEATRLNHATLRRSEDFCVDLLFAAAPTLGIPLLTAEFPRCYVDVNRASDEIDPALFKGASQAALRSASRRVANGLGVIPRVVGAGIDIYDAALPITEAHLRLAQFHAPYHDALAALSDQVARHFNQSLLIDCHSMPDSAAGRRLSSGRTPDIVIGDLHGRACAPSIARAALDCFSQLGYRVVRNDPYAGGYTTQRYGTPLTGRHCLQIEINRRLYMDERRLKFTRAVKRLKEDLEAFTEHMAQHMEALNTTDAAAVAAE